MGLGVEKIFEKLLNTKKGPGKNYNIYMQIFPIEEEGGTLVSIFLIK